MEGRCSHYRVGVSKSQHCRLHTPPTPPPEQHYNTLTLHVGSIGWQRAGPVGMASAIAGNVGMLEAGVMGSIGCPTV